MQTQLEKFEIPDAAELRKVSEKAIERLTQTTIASILAQMENASEKGAKSVTTSIVPCSSKVMDEFFNLLRKKGYYVGLIGHRVSIDWQGPTNKQNGPI